MMSFKKTLHLFIFKVVPLALVGTMVFESIAYAMDWDTKCNLRVMVSGDAGGRFKEAYTIRVNIKRADDISMSVKSERNDLGSIKRFFIELLKKAFLNVKRILFPGFNDSRREFFIKSAGGIVIGPLLSSVGNILGWEGEKIVGKDIAGTVVGPFGDRGIGTERIFGEDGGIGFKLVVPEDKERKNGWGSYGIDFNAPLDVSGKDAKLIIKVRANRDEVGLQINFRDDAWRKAGRFGEIQASTRIKLGTLPKEISMDLNKIQGRARIDLVELVHIAFEYVDSGLGNQAGDTIIIDQIKFTNAGQEEPEEPEEPIGAIDRDKVVIAQDKNLYVDARPYPIIGVTIERDNFTINDIELLRQLNVNTVRAYYPITDEQILDALANAGIKVIMGIPWSDKEGGCPSLSDGSYLSYIEEFKNHPAILFWELGNEYNFIFRYPNPEITLERWWEELENAVTRIKEIDKNHPVTTTLLIYDIALGNGDIKRAENAGIDAIGMNVYSWDDPQPVIDMVRDMANVPLYFSETGADSYDTRIQSEDQDAHKEAVLNIYNVINRNLRIRGKKNHILGFTLMTLKDNPRKSGNPFAQDPGGYSDTGVPPDNFSNEDYWGLFTQDGIAKKVVGLLSEEFNLLTHLDVSRDGNIDMIDLLLVAKDFGKSGKGLPGDVNGDGIVNILDLTLVARYFGRGMSAAPPKFDRQNLETILEYIPIENRKEVEQCLLSLFNEPALAKYYSKNSQGLLLNPYPNPASSKSNITYYAPSEGEVSIQIFDVHGGVVTPEEKITVNNEGYYTWVWDLKNSNGENVRDGIYFVKAEFTQGHRVVTDVKKIVVIRIGVSLGGIIKNIGAMASNI